MGTAFYTFNATQNAKLAYTQSDEISILMIDYTTNETEPWFGNRLDKIVSISASLASSYFTHYLSKIKRIHKNMVEFDSRVFLLPTHEVENYFIWRWRDCVKNSVLSVAQKHFSSKMLSGKNHDEQHEMLHKIGVNWATDFNDHEKNGSIITSEGVLSAPDSTDKWRELVRKEVYIND
jgi:tRNA(His) 5'-end guanylyltransferase